MIIFKSINKLNKEVNFKAKVGFVPTMGSLHKGHISLIKSSRKKCQKTLVSIFVNPSQFNNKNDYKNYPRNLKKDINFNSRVLSAHYDRLNNKWIVINEDGQKFECTYLILAVGCLDNSSTNIPKFSGLDSFEGDWYHTCLLYTSPSPRDRTRSRMPSSA